MSNRDIAYLELFEALEAQIKLLEEEKKHSSIIFENIAEGIVIIDDDGYIIKYNKMCEEYFRMCGFSALGTKIEAVNFSPEIADAAYKCIKDGGSVETEVHLNSWPQRIFDVIASPYHCDFRDCNCAVITIKDITHIRNYEQSQKEFVSNVSHELKTPITIIRSSAEAILASGKFEKEVLERFLGRIIDESDRLSGLIESLMSIARLDSGVVALNKTKIKLKKLVEQSVSVLLTLINEKKQILNIDIENDIMVSIDVRLMELVIGNLVDNAIKFTENRGKITVSAKVVNSEIIISVSDTGIGMSKNECERIFERFYRIDKARSRQTTGTGLGLSIVKDIVEKHNGKINVLSELGKGSIFIVNLPRE